MRRKKRFLSSFLLLLLLLIGALFLTYKFVVPVWIERVIEGKLEKGLKKEVSLGKVDFSLFGGVELHRLIIYESEKERKVFFQAGELRIDYLPGEVLDNLREKGKDYRKWQLAFKVSSPEIISRGIRFENIYLPVLLESSRLIMEDLNAGLYRGSLNGSFSLDLGPDRKDYQFQGFISGLDLSKLGEGTSSSGKKSFKGILAGSFNLKGTAGELKDLSGYGEVSIVEGKLWELPLLGGLMAVLRAPSLEKVTFREGKATFTISEGMIATEDLILNSKRVKILAEGKMDFQGYFQPSLTYRISFSKGLLGEVPLIGNIISFVIDEAGYLIAQVEVTGSLKEPKYRLVPLVKGIKKILSIFKPSNKQN